MTTNHTNHTNDRSHTVDNSATNPERNQDDRPGGKEDHAEGGGDDEEDAAAFWGDPVYVYTRRQAIEDGVLVDVSQLAIEAGFKWPFAMTAEVWATILEPAVDSRRSARIIDPPCLARKPRHTLRVCLRFRAMPIRPSIRAAHPRSTGGSRIIETIPQNHSYEYVRRRRWDGQAHSSRQLRRENVQVA